MPFVKYDFTHFSPESIEHAKKLVLSDISLPNQWETETQWTMDFFRKKHLFNEESIVLDWGCGIGRLSKPIIEEFNCKVIGVDLQPNMLKYAKNYVDHPNFMAINNDEFSELPDDYFTSGIAVWSLMHAVYTFDIIKNIHKKLKDKSKFCVLDSHSMCWPMREIEHNTVSKNDVVFNMSPNIHKKDDENVNNFKWLIFPSLISSEITKYFSVEEKYTLSSKKEGDITLSKYFDNSWAGIFINDKKNNEVYFYK